MSKTNGHSSFNSDIDDRKSKPTVANVDRSPLSEYKSSKDSKGMGRRSEYNRSLYKSSNSRKSVNSILSCCTVNESASILGIPTDEKTQVTDTGNNASMLDSVDDDELTEYTINIKIPRKYAKKNPRIVVFPMVIKKLKSKNNLSTRSIPDLDEISKIDSADQDHNDISEQPVEDEIIDISLDKNDSESVNRNILSSHDEDDLSNTEHNYLDFDKDSIEDQQDLNDENISIEDVKILNDVDIENKSTRADENKSMTEVLLDSEKLSISSTEIFDDNLSMDSFSDKIQKNSLLADDPKTVDTSNSSAMETHEKILYLDKDEPIEKHDIRTNDFENSLFNKPETDTFIKEETGDLKMNVGPRNNIKNNNLSEFNLKNKSHQKINDEIPDSNDVFVFNITPTAYQNIKEDKKIKAHEDFRGQVSSLNPKPAIRKNSTSTTKPIICDLVQKNDTKSTKNPKSINLGEFQQPNINSESFKRIIILEEAGKNFNIKIKLSDSSEIEIVLKKQNEDQNLVDKTSKSFEDLRDELETNLSRNIIKGKNDENKQNIDSRDNLTKKDHKTNGGEDHSNENVTINSEVSTVMSNGITKGNGSMDINLDTKTDKDRSDDLSDGFSSNKQAKSKSEHSDDEVESNDLSDSVSSNRQVKSKSEHIDDEVESNDLSEVVSSKTIISKPIKSKSEHTNDGVEVDDLSEVVSSNKQITPNPEPKDNEDKKKTINHSKIEETVSKNIVFDEARDNESEDYFKNNIIEEITERKKELETVKAAGNIKSKIEYFEKK